MSPTWFNTLALSLGGGAAIGIAGSFLLVMTGKVAGISGIVGGALRARAGDTAWRWMFVAGLVVGGLVLQQADPTILASSNADPRLLAVAGLLVGAGSRLGNGCTSGHAVSGISRRSTRSVVATLTFIALGMATASLTSQWSR